MRQGGLCAPQHTAAIDTIIPNCSTSPHPADAPTGQGCCAADASDMHGHSTKHPPPEMPTCTTNCRQRQKNMCQELSSAPVGLGLCQPNTATTATSHALHDCLSLNRMRTIILAILLHHTNAYHNMTLTNPKQQTDAASHTHTHTHTQRLFRQHACTCKDSRPQALWRHPSASFAPHLDFLSDAMRCHVFQHLCTC
jgi:hypothetical protein